MDIKTNIPGLYRSEQGYLINKDNDGLAAYKKQKANVRRMNDLDDKVENLAKDLEEIKSLLRNLMAK